MMQTGTILLVAPNLLARRYAARDGCGIDDGDHAKDLALCPTA